MQVRCELKHCYYCVSTICRALAVNIGRDGICETYKPLETKDEL